jgi:hypothetical protein
MMSVISAVGGSSTYIASLEKKFSIRSKRSTSALWLALTARTA